jgi:large subunit ribosomal protein L33
MPFGECFGRAGCYLISKFPADNFEKVVLYREVLMAKKKKDIRTHIKMRSTESTYVYHTFKNRRNDPDRLQFKKYDPILRKHVLFKEER